MSIRVYFDFEKLHKNEVATLWLNWSLGVFKKLNEEATPICNNAILSITLKE